MSTFLSIIFHARSHPPTLSRIFLFRPPPPFPSSAHKKTMALLLVCQESSWKSLHLRVSFGISFSRASLSWSPFPSIFFKARVGETGNWLSQEVGWLIVNNFAPTYAPYCGKIHCRKKSLLLCHAFMFDSAIARFLTVISVCRKIDYVSKYFYLKILFFHALYSYNRIHVKGLF